MRVVGPRSRSRVIGHAYMLFAATRAYVAEQLDGTMVWQCTALVYCDSQYTVDGSGLAWLLGDCRWYITCVVIGGLDMCFDGYRRTRVLI